MKAKFAPGDTVGIKNKDRFVGPFTVAGNVLDAMGRIHCALEVFGDNGQMKGVGCQPQGRLFKVGKP